MQGPSTQITAPAPIGGVSPVGSAVNNNRYSRLHMAAATPDWMPSLAQTSTRSAPRPAAVGAPAPSSSPAPVPAPTAASPRSVGFLSMFYRAPEVSAAAAPKAPLALGADTPPMRPTAAALPVDVSLSLDAAGSGRPQMAEVRMAASPIRAPMAIGCDSTWSALGAAAVPLAKPVKRTIPVAPVPIDAALATAAPAAAPRPLWSDLPAARTAAMPSGGSAPTLEAFQPTRRVPEPPRPITISPIRADTAASPAVAARPLVPVGEEDTAAAAAAAAPRHRPVPPQPLLGSPAPARSLRPIGDDVESSASQAAASPVSAGGARKATALAEPVRDFFRGANLLLQPGKAASGPFANFTFAAKAPLGDKDALSDDDVPTLPADLTTAAAVSAKAAPQPQSQSSLFNSLFSTVHPVVDLFNGSSADTGSPSSPTDAFQRVTKSATARLSAAIMSFSEVELSSTTNNSSNKTAPTVEKSGAAAPGAEMASALAQQHQQHQDPVVDYSSILGSAFEDLDDGDDSLEHLRHIVSLVEQSARQDGAGSPTTPTPDARKAWSPTQKNGSDRNGGGGGVSETVLGAFSMKVGLGENQDCSASCAWKKPVGTSLFQGM